MKNDLMAKQKFHKEYKMFKDNHKPDRELVDIFEIFLPFWICKQNVIVETNIEIDRFSKIILQTIQAGFILHSDICKFLGVDIDSFVTIQFHFLIKNGLLNYIQLNGDIQYEITFDGLSFLENKKKIPNIETIDFEYVYSELTLEFLEKQRFEVVVTDLSKDIVDISKPFDKKNISEGKRKMFSGYRLLNTHLLPTNRNEIPHKNRPYNLNRVEFANFFNKQFADKSFYDFESNNIETHKRSICFLALVFQDKSENKMYEIRHCKKTVNEFERNDKEEILTKQTTEYFRKFPSLSDKS